MNQPPRFTLMPTPRLHPDRVQTSSERRARWVEAHLKKDRGNFNLVWPTELLTLLKAEAEAHHVSASHLLATALLLVPQHHDEMSHRVADMRRRYFPAVERKPRDPRPPRPRAA